MPCINARISWVKVQMSCVRVFVMQYEHPLSQGKICCRNGLNKNYTNSMLWENGVPLKCPSHGHFVFCIHHTSERTADFYRCTDSNLVAKFLRPRSDFLKYILVTGVLVQLMKTGAQDHRIPSTKFHNQIFLHDQIVYSLSWWSVMRSRPYLLLLV